VRRLILVLATIGVAVLLTSGAALAITYGQPDGDKHPNVGALVDSSGAYCSGTLVDGSSSGPSNGYPVFVTAAHCDYPGQVYVTFDPSYDILKRESDAIRACKRDPNCNFPWTHWTDETEYSGILDDDGQWYVRGHDIAVVVFDSNSTPPMNPNTQLPKVDELDNLQKGLLFTAVGYGVDETLTHEGERRWAVSSLTSQNSYYLSLSQQQKKGYAGTCYGDSGGPNFFGGYPNDTPINAALTNTGDALCKTKNTVLRLDTQVAHAFLDNYVDPGAFVEVPGP
jgi:hypothetical protein